MSQLKTSIDIQLTPGLARQVSEAMGLMKSLDRQGRETAAIFGKITLGKGIFENMSKLKAEFGGLAGMAVHSNQQIIASYTAMGGKLATEMRGLKGVSAEVATAMNREFKGAFAGAQSEIAGLNRQIAEMSSRMRGLGGGGGARSIRHGAHTGGGLVDTIAMGPQHSGVYAGLNVEHGLGGLLEPGGELKRQLNLYRLGGASPSDVAAARSAAFRSSVLVPDVGVTEQMKLYRELSGATGDDAGARMILPQVAKTMSIMEAVTGQHSDAAMKQLFKFIELRGVAINEATHKIDVGKFGGELDYATKAMVAAQGLITSNDMLQFAKQAGPMAKGMSGEELFTTMLAAMEDMGGSRAGTSLTAVGRQYLGGIMTGGKAQRLKELGLLNAAGTETTDSGGIKITDPTKAIVGYDVLTKSGFGAFMEQVIRPHMQEHGITGRQQQNEELYRSVGTDTARRLMGLYLSGHEQVGIVAERYRRAMPGSQGYDQIFGNGQDLETSTKAVREAFTTLKTALGDAPAVSQSLMVFARGIAGVADMVKDHPALGTAATLGGVGASASLLGYGALQTVKGFGLPAAATQLSAAAVALDAAAVKLGGGSAAVDAMKTAGAGAAGAGATFGLGGITIAGGALAGGYLDSNFGGNYGALGRITGQLGDAEKSARFLAEQEAERAKGPLYGQRANILDNLRREREVAANLAKPDDPGLLTRGLDAVGVGSAEERRQNREKLRAEAEANIARMERELAEVEKKISEHGTRIGRQSALSTVEAFKTADFAGAGTLTATATKTAFQAGDFGGAGTAAATALLRGFLGALGGMGGGGEAGSLIQRASFGGFGSNDNGSFGGASGVARALSGGPGNVLVPDSVSMTADERRKLGLIQKFESNGRNVPNYINDRMHTAQGYYQITNSNWRRLAPALGITAPNAMSASREDQTRVALRLLRANPNMSDWTPKARSAYQHGYSVPSVSRQPAPTASAPPARPHEEVHIHNVYLDGDKIERHVTRRQVAKMRFPTSVGGTDSYGNWHGPGTAGTKVA